MPVFDAPEDDADDASRQSYNFCPGYHGLVYRAETRQVDGHGIEEEARTDNGDADGGAYLGAVEATEEREQVASGSSPVTSYKLQSMKWGLIPFWTKRNPDYASIITTINCRDDSLVQNAGLWTTMKKKKRCIVIAEGFYEWLKKGKEKIPYYTKRKDGMLMCLAGLWDCVQYEGMSCELLIEFTSSDFTLQALMRSITPTQS